jgi:hypothetical protein
MSSDVSQLTKLKKLFSGSGKWIQGTYARTETDIMVSPASRTAVCFCLLGGLKHVAAGDDAIRTVAIAITKVDPSYRTKSGGPEGKIINWNDKRTRRFGEIRTVVSVALKLAKEQAKK